MTDKTRRFLSSITEVLGEGARAVIDLPQARAAAHEAGHALVAWSSISVARLTGARLHGRGEGRVTFVIRNASVDRSATWDSTAICLAGLAGEISAFGTVRSGGASVDLMDALAHAERIERNGWLVPWSPSPQRKLDIGAMFASRPPPDVCRALGECYRRAREIIIMRPDLFRLLARELLRQGELGAAEIERLLGPRPWAMFR